MLYRKAMDEDYEYYEVMYFSPFEVQDDTHREMINAKIQCIRERFELLLRQKNQTIDKLKQEVEKLKFKVKEYD